MGCLCAFCFPPNVTDVSPAGRSDSQVKVRGHRVNLREVEGVIQGVAGVETVVTLACDTKSGFRS